MKASAAVVVVMAAVALGAAARKDLQEEDAQPRRGIPAPPPHPGRVGRRRDQQCPPPPSQTCPACPECRTANLSRPQPICPPAVCPTPSCPPPTCPSAPACSGKAAACNGCLWKVLVTYDHFQGVGFYKAYKSHVNWHQAKTLCIADGGHLGIINSKKELEIYKLLYQHNQLSGLIFIGFHDLNKEGSFETVLDQPLSSTGYVKWRQGQPDSFGNDDCGTIDSNALLNDGNCYWKTSFICEVSETKVFGQ